MPTLPLRGSSHQVSKCHAAHCAPLGCTVRTRTLACSHIWSERGRPPAARGQLHNGPERNAFTQRPSGQRGAEEGISDRRHALGQNRDLVEVAPAVERSWNLPAGGHLDLPGDGQGDHVV